jgi:diguanylate cyclase (GGDEF)-like protein
VFVRKDDAMSQVVLLVEANSPNASLVKQALVGANDASFVVERVRKCSEAQQRLSRDRDRTIAAVVTNLFLPDSQGLETIARIFEVCPRIPILVLTNADNEYIAKQALLRGAQDYVLQHRLDNYFLPKILQNMLSRAANVDAPPADRAAGPAANSVDDALHDYLTGLPNSLLLSDRLGQAVAFARRHQQLLSVLCVDIDRFKHVNYALGHEIGDRLLHSIAARIVAATRTSDTVGRQGGDKFLVLLPALTHAEDAVIGAQRILASVRTPHCIEKYDLQVTATVGIAIYPHDGSDAETLVRNSGVAMLNAKELGHNRYGYFRPHMNEQAIERRFLECGLRHALERQEFVLHYQPQVDLTTEAIVGAEALVRWRRPKRGIALPVDFMPVAEQSGHIVQIGLWALREACRQARSWRDANLLPIPVAVNITAVELRAKGFAESLRVILLETGMEPHRLELEIVESALLKDRESAAAVLHTVRDMGVQVALDHFGADSASLTHLKRLPLDALKIDQSLVHGLSSCDDDGGMVDAVISAAKSFHLRVIAQGVDTKEQFLALQNLQCHGGQGRYFSDPLPGEEFAKLLAAQSRSASDVRRLAQKRELSA